MYDQIVTIDGISAAYYGFKLVQRERVHYFKLSNNGHWRTLKDLKDFPGLIQFRIPKLYFIPNRYYIELVDCGHTVPRNESTGDNLTFKVGKDYEIHDPVTKNYVIARCTQDCPYALKLLHIPIKPTTNDE